MKLRLVVIIFLVSVSGFGVFRAITYTSSAPESTNIPAPREDHEDSGGGRFHPLRPPGPLNTEKVALGEALFRDPRLSHDNSISCASCHDLGRGGADGRSSAVGIGGQQGEINTPSVFNAALNFAQFWDGRATTLEQQARGPVHNPAEMGSSWPEVVAKLSAAGDYNDTFRRLFAGGLTGDNIAAAIAEYERSLVTPDSRFDEWLLGNEEALSADEKAGFRLFRDFGCGSCHQGVNLGGNMYQKFGIFAPFTPPGRGLRASDLGRFNVTGDTADKGVFKVPSLRNVTRTAPYFHDGSSPSLEDAVAVMARVQLGREISESDRRQIVAFLGTLTGKYKGKPL